MQSVQNDTANFEYNRLYVSHKERDLSHIGSTQLAGLKRPKT